LNLRATQDLVAKIRTQKSKRVQVDFATEQIGRLAFDRELPKTDANARLEFDEDVDIAGGPKIA
jgi:hypothetical protein